jgi:hypothetical protein
MTFFLLDIGISLGAALVYLAVAVWSDSARSV